MVYLCLKRSGPAALFAALLLTTIAANAKDGRDFAGFYSLSDAREQGSQVQVTLALQVFNYSGADLRGAVVTLHESHPDLGVLGSFAPIALWHSNNSIVVKQRVTVSKDEYLRWAGHGQPGIFVTYNDAGGQERQCSAQLSQRAALP